MRWLGMDLEDLLLGWRSHFLITIVLSLSFALIFDPWLINLNGACFASAAIYTFREGEQIRKRRSSLHTVNWWKSLGDVLSSWAGALLVLWVFG